MRSADPTNATTRPPKEDGGRVHVDRATLLSVMRRPSSLGLLALAIVMAVGFSLLGQWQLGRAFENGAVIESESEDPLPIEREVPTQVQTPSSAVGQLLTASGSWVTDDFSVLNGRLNDGARGAWVIGHFLTDSGDSLAVGIGWTPELTEARTVADRLASGAEVLPSVIEGRYQQSEQPTVDTDAQPGDAPSEMAVPALVNEWTDGGPVYAGYLTLREAPEGVETIYSPAPERQVQLNFLNLFYTLEWALFALIALYIWYRHMRDIAEKEIDSCAGQAGADGGDPDAGGPAA